MNKYFYSDGQQSFGPYGLEELRAMSVVGPSTKVWCQGMADWADASTVDEMGDWFVATPPPIKVVIQGNEPQTIEIHTNQSGGQAINEQKPPIPFSWLVPSIIATVCCCVPFGIVGIVYAAKVDTRYNQGDYQGAQAAADSAKTWFWWSVGVAGFIYLCWIAVVLLGVIGSSLHYSDLQ